MTLRISVLAFVLTLALSPLEAEAQLQLRTSGTRVRVHNASRDRATTQVRIIVDGKPEQVHTLLPGGTLNRMVHCGPLWGWLQEASSCEIVVTVRACGVPVRYAVYPAERTQWRLGSLAITPEFLASLEEPGTDQEALVKEKVEAIREAIKKWNGRDPIIKDLEDWSKAVRKHGHMQENSCPGGEQSAWRDVVWDNFYHGAVLAFWITGTRNSLELGPWR